MSTSSVIAQHFVPLSAPAQPAAQGPGPRYEMLKQSLEMESTQMNERLGEATNQRASTEEAKHAAKGELEETTASEKSPGGALGSGGIRVGEIDGSKCPP